MKKPIWPLWTLIGITLIFGTCSAGTIDDALFTGIAKRDIQEVGRSISEGADVNAKNSKGDTPLTLVISEGYSDIECLALATPIMSGQVVVTAADMSGKGGSIDDKTNKELGSLVESKCQEPVEIVKLLIDKGADVNAKDQNGRTPLMTAAIKGYVEITKLLIDKGADVNIRSGKGETALSLAKANNNIEISSLLTAAGAR